MIKRHEKVVDAEILHRELKIPHPEDYDNEVKATTQLLEKTSIKIKKRRLMEDELGVQAKALKRKGVPLLLVKIKAIQAQSEAMKKLIGELDQ